MQSDVKDFRDYKERGELDSIDDEDKVFIKLNGIHRNGVLGDDGTLGTSTMIAEIWNVLYDTELPKNFMFNPSNLVVSSKIYEDTLATVKLPRSSNTDASVARLLVVDPSLDDDMVILSKAFLTLGI